MACYATLPETGTWKKIHYNKTFVIQEIHYNETWLYLFVLSLLWSLTRRKVLELFDDLWRVISHFSRRGSVSFIQYIHETSSSSTANNSMRLQTKYIYNEINILYLASSFQSWQRLGKKCFFGFLAKRDWKTLFWVKCRIVLFSTLDIKTLQCGIFLFVCILSNRPENCPVTNVTICAVFLCM